MLLCVGSYLADCPVLAAVIGEKQFPSESLFSVPLLSARNVPTSTVSGADLQWLISHNDEAHCPVLAAVIGQKQFPSESLFSVPLLSARNVPTSTVSGADLRWLISHSAEAHWPALAAVIGQNQFPSESLFSVPLLSARYVPTSAVSGADLRWIISHSDEAHWPVLAAVIGQNQFPSESLFSVPLLSARYVPTSAVSGADLRWIISHSDEAHWPVLAAVIGQNQSLNECLFSVPPVSAQNVATLRVRVESVHLPIPGNSRTQPLLSSCFEGGGKGQKRDNTQFQHTNADVGKQVQRLKELEHGLAPKQIRMLLVSDQKLYAKVARTTNQQHLTDCVIAAAKRMGLLEKSNSDTARHDSGQPSSSTGGKKEGKGRTAAIAPVNPSPPSQPSHTPSKGKDKDHNQRVQLGKDDTAEKGKSKGKGAGKTLVTALELSPKGWNVRPATVFNETYGGVYAVENEDEARQIAEKGVNRNYPIGIFAPRPFDIGTAAPEPLFVEFLQEQAGSKHLVTIQGYLHQVTQHKVTYMKTAKTVTLTKPEVAKTHIAYITFLDQGASEPMRLDLQQKKTYVAKTWIQSLLPAASDINLLDVWNMQEVQNTQGTRQYQVSVRLPKEHVPKLLATSMPGKLQINVPGHLRQNMTHIWLKNQNGPLNDTEVRSLVDNLQVPHLGCFQLRGVWALRALPENIESIRAIAGRQENPAYFVKGCPGDWDQDDLMEIAKQINWQIQVKSENHRWYRGARTWMVRAAAPPTVFSFPVFYGYERRVITIDSARKQYAPKQENPQKQEPPTFNSWSAQMRQRLPRTVTNSRFETAKEALLHGSPPSKKMRVPTVTLSHPAAPAGPSRVRAMPSSSDDTAQLLQQLQQQNAEQQAQISALLDQIAKLTQSLSELSAQIPTPEDEEMPETRS